MNRFSLPLRYAMIGLACLLIGAGAAWYFISRSVDSPLPDDIREQINFSPLVIPADSTIPTKSYQYTPVEDGVNILTFIATIGNVEVTLTEYPQPPSFAEIPEYQQRFLENVIQQSGSVSTAGGTIYLGQQSLQDNQPLGVMLENGLVVFMRPDQPLDESAWRRLGDQLTLERIN